MRPPQSQQADGKHHALFYFDLGASHPPTCSNSVVPWVSLAPSDSKYDVPLWATIVRLSERLTFPTYWNAATITQIAKQIGSQNRLVSSNLLTSMTTSTTGTTISNTKWLRGNARPTLEEVWRSPLCTSPVLCSCSTGTIIVDTGTGSAINTICSSTPWDHLLHHTGVVGNQIARWGGDHQRMLTHIQCVNVCT